MDTNCYCLCEYHNYRTIPYLSIYITARQRARNSIELRGFLLLVDFMGHIAGGRQYTAALFRVLLGVCAVAVGGITVHAQVLDCDVFEREHFLRHGQHAVAVSIGIR